jgi:glycosyltransferase involved in cell wall biosynthesis
LLRVVHLMASPFYGGPERQVLGLARHLPSDVESVFLSFAERGLAQPFLDEAARHGFTAKALRHNTPRFLACVAEVADELRRLQANLLCCSGYKPDLVGWRAARRVGIPVMSISHGWTAATWRVRFYEALDRWVLRRFDAVACVSQAQADKVRRTGLDDSKIAVIRNSIGPEAFVEPDAAVRAEMEGWFRRKPRWLIGAAGRFSREKGFAIFVAAAEEVAIQRPDAGFVLFGDGPTRPDLERRIADCGLQEQFILAGFRTDLVRFLPNLDLGVMSSFTEGLPVILLEMGAAGVPTVATAVGGIPEVIDDGQDGCLVPPGDPQALANRIVAMLDDDARRRAMGRAARTRVERDFSFAAMGRHYHELFRKLTQGRTEY